MREREREREKERGEFDDKRKYVYNVYNDILPTHCFSQLTCRSILAKFELENLKCRLS